MKTITSRKGRCPRTRKGQRFMGKVAVNGDGKNPSQSGSELFELFDYSNSKDRIVVFGIRIRSIFKTRIVFELFE